MKARVFKPRCRLTDDASLLQHFVETEFIPAHAKARSYAYQFIAVYNWLRKILLRPATLADLNRRTFADFMGALEEMGASKQRRHYLRRAYLLIWRDAHQRGYDVPKCDVPHANRVPKLPAPEGAKGTLVWFYRTIYRCEVIPHCPEETDEAYYTMFRRMRTVFGRDLLLSELDAEKLSTYVGYLQRQGRGQQTIKNHRSIVVALWRYAFARGDGPPLPPLRKLKAEREQPDAWSLEEMPRIIAAARRIERRPIGTVPAKKFWPALLLTCYYTALRRRTLARIRPGDVDLDAGTLYVPALHVKNRRGMKFKLGPDAIAAIREIYDPRRKQLFPMPMKSADARHLYLHFSSILRAAGVEKGNRIRMSLFHKMRRTSVTHTAVRAGMAQAIALAGHSGPEVNARYIDPSFLPQHDATAWLPMIGTTG